MPSSLHFVQQAVSNLFDRSAKCKNFKLVRGQIGIEEMGRGCPPPSRLRGVEERCKLPLAGSGAVPGRKRVLAYFRA